MTVPNLYAFCDDSASTSTSGGGTGAGSGQPLGTFTAPSGTAAITMTHLLASVMQRPLRVGSVYAPAYAPWTLVVGAPCAVALTSVPSGAGWG